MSSLETSYCLQDEPRLVGLVRVGGAVVLAIVGGALVATGLGVHGGGRIGAYLFAIFAFAMCLLLGRVGIRSLVRPPAVKVGPEGITATDFFGASRSAPLEQIQAIEVRTRSYGRSVMPNRVPYARMRDGSGFWLDALAVPDKPTPKGITQTDMLAEIRARLGHSDLGPT